MRSHQPLHSVVFVTEPCVSPQVFYGSRRLAGGSATSYCQGSEASQTMQPAWEPQSGCGARIGWHGQTSKHSQASSREQAIRGCLRLGPKGKRSGSGSRTWPDANVAPPVYRVDLTHLVVDAEHGKAVRSHPALAVPRQAHRKAGPGETALRGSNKPKPLCNRADTPTSIWSFIVRKSMEPFELGKANDDRRQSISASRSRRQERCAIRPSVSIAKVAPFGVGRGMPHRICPLKGLSRMKGNFHVRF